MIGVPWLYGNDFTQLQVNEDKKVNFYSFVPLYKEEVTFKLKRGADPLLQRFDNLGVTELLDVNRPNVCKRRFGIF